jgi:hypothetical protein
VHETRCARCSASHCARDNARDKARRFAAPSVDPATRAADPTVQAVDAAAVDPGQRGDIEASGQRRIVLRASDGDTIVVLPGDKKLDHVRPFMVDTPERTSTRMARRTAVPTMPGTRCKACCLSALRSS